MTLTIIPVGFFDSDLSVLSPNAAPGQRLRIPVYSYLIRTTHSLILFDTGCSHQCRTDPVGLLGEETVPYLTPELTPDDHISAQLQKLGLTAGDIDLVVNSHCHFDHAGGNEVFVSTLIAMQQAEYDAAASDREAYPDLAYHPADRSRLTLFHGDTELEPKVALIFTPGHTLGHQSLLLELSDRAVLITSDAVYTRAHFSIDCLGAAKDTDLAQKSLKRLLEIVQDGARPFFSHDPDQAAQEGWKLAPYEYV
jgi:N-acyl homoserine lactone hydrolase